MDDSEIQPDEGANAENTENIPLILNGKFFRVVSDGDPKVQNTQIKAKCVLCVKSTILCGTKTSTGNFFKHLRRKHPEGMKRLDALKLEMQKENLKRRIDLGAGPSNQKKLCTPFEQCKTNNRISSNNIQINELICNYIIQEMLPVVTVEKDSFKKLIAGLTGGINPPCRQTIMKKIFNKKDEFVEKLKNEFKSIPYVCTTADIWSANNKSYFGVTCHYLDNALIRHSTVLACKRIKFAHTYVEIGKMLSDIHKSYHLTATQIVGTVTDNASNFGKAFRIYSLPENVECTEYDFLNGDNKGVTIHDIANFSDILHDVEVVEEVEDLGITLPPHYRCASHTLNLVATKDCEAALKEGAFRKIHNSTFGKLTALWNYVHRSTLASDEVEQICGKKLLVPCPTRWNSLFDSVQRVLNLKEHLPAICDKLGKVRFKNIELDFMLEYITVMEPLACGIDMLQGESNCFLGYVLPTLIQIKASLNSLTHLMYCAPLRDAILNGISSRYQSITDLTNNASKPYILATISIPKFKLKWLNSLGTLDSIEQVKSLFFNECKKIYDNNFKSDACDDDSDSKDDFFTILQPQRESFNEKGDEGNQNQVQMQCLQYLDDKSKDLSSLLHYNVVLTMFKMYNTILPSSAPVERLFSAGGQILTPRRNRLSDETFETLLTLRTTNKN